MRTNFWTNKITIWLPPSKRLILGSYYLAKDNQEKFLSKQKARRVIKQYYNQILNQYDCVIFPSYIGVAPDVENIENSSSDKDNF